MEYVKLGTIIDSYSLDGTFKVFSTTDFAKERYKKGSLIYLYNKDKEYIPLTVVSFRMNGKLDLVKCEEINNKEEAESFKGCELVIPKEEAKLPKGYYHLSELERCSVYSINDELLGKVVKAEEYPAQITLRVKQENGKEFLVPFVKAFIKKVDIENEKIVIEVIEGML